ncbi:hypothetical protein [Streptomyces sp. NPDC057301]|uniref:hypothetical protein n=1 Tax=Streptomyces sp. NPDC057301 TaxID=3346093 RepID=UPI00362DC339
MALTAGVVLVPAKLPPVGGGQRRRLRPEGQRQEATEETSVSDSGASSSLAYAEAFAALLAMPAAQLADVYPLDREHADGFRGLTGITLGLDRFDYFLEAVAD